MADQAPALPTIVALVASQSSRVAVDDALRGTVRVRYCHRVHDLPPLVRRTAPSALLSEPRDGSGMIVIDALRALKQHYPALPVIAYVIPRPDDLRPLLLEHGLRIDAVIFRGTDDVRSIVRATLIRVSERQACTAIAGVTKDLIPAVARDFFAYCAGNAWRPLRVLDVAAAIGTSLRTVEATFRRAGLPAPRHVIGWHRVLFGAWHLDSGGPTIEDLAEALGYSSASALSHQFRRYAGFPPSQLRARGGFRGLLDVFRTAISTTGEPVRPSIASWE